MSTTQSGKTLLAETRDLMRRLHYSIGRIAIGLRALCDFITCRRERLYLWSRRKKSKIICDLFGGAGG
jgi:hypothetical protein